MGNILCSKEDENSKFSSRVISEAEVNGSYISLIQGDIFEEEIDAIVNQSANILKNTNNIIIRRAGVNRIREELEDYVNTFGPLSFGKACHTNGGYLRAKKIIHLSLPLWCEGSTEEITQLRSSYNECFKLAQTLNIKSLGFTEFAGELSHFPKSMNTEILISETFKFLSKEKAPGSKLRRIKFIILDLKIIDYFKTAFEKERDQFYKSISSDALLLKNT